MGDMSPALPEDHGYGSAMGGEAFFTGRAGRRQGPRFSIRMVIGIFCSDTETGAVTPPDVMQKK